jgi:hypothetical protein
MIPTSLTSDVRPAPGDDALDRLLSDFFKRPLRRPWPPAPRTLATEPSLVAAARSAAAPRTRSAAHDPSTRARYTLAVSAAVLLGTCWCLSDGFRAADRPPPAGPAQPFLNVLPEAGANDPEALKERRKDKAINGEGAGAPKIQLP